MKGRALRRSQSEGPRREMRKVNQRRRRIGEGAKPAQGALPPESAAHQHGQPQRGSRREGHGDAESAHLVGEAEPHDEATLGADETVLSEVRCLL
mgnify:FL=1